MLLLYVAVGIDERCGVLLAQKFGKGGIAPVEEMVVELDDLAHATAVYR